MTGSLEFQDDNFKEEAARLIRADNNVTFKNIILIESTFKSNFFDFFACVEPNFKKGKDLKTGKATVICLICL